MPRLDNLTHTLIGVGLARAGLAQRHGRGTTLTLAIASNLPDIDVFWSMWDRFDLFTLRRTHSHALLALPVLAGLYVVLTRRWLRPMPASTVFALAALGIAGHLLFDLVNAFGVVLLWPFSATRFELSSVFIIDLGIWAIGLAPLLATLWRRRGEVLHHRASLLALAVYVALCAGARVRAEAIATAHAPGASQVEVFPEPLGPHRFRAAVRSGDTWTLYLVHILSGRVEPGGTFAHHAGSPRVEACRCAPHGRRIDAFAGAPAWTEAADGAVEVRDLRFESLVIPRPNIFRMRFPPGSVVPHFE